MAKSKGDGKKAKPASTLDGSPSHLLHRALQLALDMFSTEAGPDALTQRQYAVLAAVAEHEGLTQTDLVRATGIDRSTLADMAARMIGKGLLARERSVADARANTVRLTDKGRAALAEAAPRAAAADRRILSLLPAGKRTNFVAILRDLSHAADALVEADGEEAVAEAKKRKKAKLKEPKAAKPPKAERVKPPKPEKKKKKKAKKAKGEAAPEEVDPTLEPTP